MSHSESMPECKRSRSIDGRYKGTLFSDLLAEETFLVNLLTVGALLLDRLTLGTVLLDVRTVGALVLDTSPLVNPLRFKKISCFTSGINCCELCKVNLL